jgi:hypothetical protein
MRLAWIGIAALAAVAFVAPVVAETGADGRPVLLGKDPGEISITEWMNTDGRTKLADFRGEVVLFKAWGTN